MTAAIDYCRRRRQGRAPARTQITDRIVGYRDSAIRAYLDSKTVEGLGAK
jgi:predicted DNA-binding transcriptional regulator AlpA